MQYLSGKFCPSMWYDQDLQCHLDPLLDSAPHRLVAFSESTWWVHALCSLYHSIKLNLGLLICWTPVAKKIVLTIFSWLSASSHVLALSCTRLICLDYINRLPSLAVWFDLSQWGVLAGNHWNEERVKVITSVSPLVSFWASPKAHRSLLYIVLSAFSFLYPLLLQILWVYGC